MFIMGSFHVTFVSTLAFCCPLLLFIPWWKCTTKGKQDFENAPFVVSSFRTCSTYTLVVLPCVKALKYFKLTTSRSSGENREGGSVSYPETLWKWTHHKHFRYYNSHFTTMYHPPQLLLVVFHSFSRFLVGRFSWGLCRMMLDMP